jgi:hypothetical protein
LRDISPHETLWRFFSRRSRFHGFVDRVALSLEQALDSLPQVLQQVPSIGDLLRFGCSFRCRLGVRGCTVPADKFNTRVLLEPVLHTLSIAVRQEIDNLSPLQVDYDGAVPSPFAPRPIIQTD